MAAEVWEDDIFFDVLSYSTPNNSGSMVCYASNNKVVASFDLPQGRYIRYVDIIFQVATNDSFSNITISSTSTSTQKALTIVELGSNRYRAYGKFTSATTKPYITITGSTLYAVTFDSFRITYQSFTTYDETGTCDISAYSYSNTINYVPTDTINYRSFLGASDPELNSLVTWTRCPNWRKYDYIDFMFSFDVTAINSVRVSIGDSIVPCEVSYLDSDGINGHFWFSVRVDLTSVNRTSLNELMVTVSGKVNSGGSNFISVDGIRGYIDAGDVNILHVFLRNIVTELASIKTALVGDSTSGDQFKDETDVLIQDLGGISDAMNSVDRPSMDSINTDFSGEINGASALMSTVFTEVMEVPWLSRFILASLTLGLLAFILYGKE